MRSLLYRGVNHWLLKKFNALWGAKLFCHVWGWDLYFYFCYICILARIQWVWLWESISWTLFSDSERFLWNKEHGYLHCVGKPEETGQCKWLTDDNLQYYTRPPNARSLEHTGLLIFARNDCEGRHCCARDFCTRYTTGAITSILSYPYGSFRFLSKPLSKTSNVIEK